MSRAGSAWALAALAAAGVAGCQSTQDRSAELKKKAGTVLSKTTQTVVTRTSPDIRVVQTATLSDRNGAAAVVELRNTSTHAFVNLPIAIDVKDGHGASLFRNDATGLEPSLVGPAFVAAKADFTWVNDQVTAGSPPRSVAARIGVAPGPTAAVPRIDVTPPHLETDPVSGISAVGRVVNRSTILQRKLVLYCVARRGNRVVAAGRGGIDRLRPGKPTRYTIFFIGNPKGAKLTVSAPPTTFH
jgi:hypothetical protein